MGNVIERVRTVLKEHQPIGIHSRVGLERTLAGLSVRQAARALGWSHVHWLDIEEGKVFLANAELRRIAKVLGCSFERLVGRQARTQPGWKKMGRPRRPVTQNETITPRAAA